MTATPALRLFALIATLLLAACSQRSGSDVAEEAGGVPDLEFLMEHGQWREARREALLATDGWTSVVGLHWLELNAHYIGSARTNGIRLEQGPPQLGLLQQQDGRVFFTPERGVAASFNGQPIKRRVELLADRAGHADVIGFDDGKGQIVLLERGKRKALRVRHADADARLSFSTLDYWPVDVDWKIPARFIAHARGKTLDILDITSLLRSMPNPGVVEFERDGRTYRLEALDDGTDGLFLIFADRTSGHGSYSAGRYLYTSRPGVDGVLELDFNRAINPPCAFTDFATCPLPPPQNRLDLAITAGEKNYAGPVR